MWRRRVPKSKIQCTLPGMSESEILAVVEEAIRIVNPRQSFSYYDPDDLKQECRIWCLQVLHKYDENRGSLRTFLIHHIKNRLINLRRDRVERHTPPCAMCDNNNGECKLYDDMACCEKWQKWILRNTAKKSLAEPYDVEKILNTDAGSYNHQDISENLAQSELFKLVDEKLPLNMRGDFLRLIDGVKIPKDKRQKLLETIREIISDERIKAWET